ncbi:MAG TPA: heme lyase CcmF/NrfE family subunit, partial [Anaerolineae bacterium]|nr:heme lyase CcmF/NrfE family subunit [Anaerolineae bacterium]
IALVIALVVSVAGIGMNLAGVWLKRPALVVAGRNALYVVGGFVVLASLALVLSLVSRDYSLTYVANQVSNTQPLFYNISSFWGGQAGSLLFWTLILAGYSVAVTLAQWKRQPVLRPYVTAVLLGVLLFFLSVVIFVANPFARLWLMPDGSMPSAVFAPVGAVPAQLTDGSGLNPILQNYWMVIHPVMLYLGWIGLTVPFAFAVAALVTGELGNDWIRTIRRWTLVPWMFLTAGVLMGSQWAYVELGWGGYWAWDPVENASFLPWLTATAFLHSIMIQERRGMLKVWNMALIFMTFELTIVGTFITRSGIIESVHAFAQSDIGPFFLTFIVTTMFGFLALLGWRLPDLRSPNHLDSMVSRESAFLFNNLILVGIAVATLFGTLYPIISDALSQVLPIEHMSFAAPWFNKVTGPLFVLLIALMGSAPLLGWRRSSKETLVKNFTFPLLFGLAIGALGFWLGNQKLYPTISYAVAGFVLGGIMQEFYRGAKVRRASKGENWLAALFQLLRRNQRRYGGYIVHLGVVMIMIAIVGVNVYQSEGQANLAQGETMQVENYVLTFTGLTQSAAPSYDAVEATLQVARNDRPAGIVTPAMHFYRTVAGRDQPTNEIAIRMGLAEDLYVVLAGWEGTGQTASFKVYVNPMMSWMWIGGVVMLLGTLAAVWPHQKETERVLVPAPAPRGTQPA